MENCSLFENYRFKKKKIILCIYSISNHIVIATKKYTVLFLISRTNNITVEIGLKLELLSF